MINSILDRNRDRKVVFYGRVSTEHEAQLDALQNQMQWYQDQLNYHKNWKLQKQYIDKGITGTQAKKRPAFIQMMEDAKKGEFDLIVTREVCRFARNTVDTLVATRSLKNIGVEVYFVEDNIWTMDGDGELRLTIMATLAQEESRKISERVRAGQKISRDNGILYGNGNILGYNRVDGSYVIDEEQAETVRLIYNLYLCGNGIKKITNELCRLQRKDAYGNVKWSPSKIDRILRNSTYKGVMAYGKSQSNNYLDQKRISNHDADTYIYIEGNFAPIIEKSDWDKAQEIRKSKVLKVNVEGKNIVKGKRIAEDIWLRKLKCCCGSTFRRNKWRTNKKSNEEVFGYQCYNQVNNGSKAFREKNGLDTDGYCDIRMIGDWKLDLMAKVILETIWVKKKDAVVEAYKMIADCYVSEEKPKERELLELTNKLNKINHKIDNLIDMRTEGEISKDEYGRKRKELDEQKKAIELQLTGITTIKADIHNSDKNLALVNEALDEYIDFSQPTISDDVIERLVKTVIPMNNHLFKWTLDFLYNNENTPVCGIEGRKNKPVIVDRFGNRLPLYQSSTGSVKQLGSIEIASYLIDEAYARRYQKKHNMRRLYAWQDIKISIYF